MAIFTFSVCTLWLLCWVMWFFCVPGSKWFDNQLHYDTWEFNGFIYVVMVTILAVLSAGFGFLSVYLDYPYTIRLAITGVIGSSIALVLWCVSFCVFAMHDFHKKLREKRNY